MSCSFDKEIIQKYVDNTIDPLEFIFLKEHLSYCGECRSELDLVMNLENQLSKFFDEDCEAKELDLLITKLVDDCMDEALKSKKLKYAISKGVEMSSRIMDNSTRFVEYLPGRKSLGKGAKKTASFAGGLLKAVMKKEVGKLRISWE